MATKITDRAEIVAEGIIPANGVSYKIYADTQVGQRVHQSYPNRYWLVISRAGMKTIRTSTQNETLYKAWLGDIASHGKAA